MARISDLPNEVLRQIFQAILSGNKAGGHAITDKNSVSSTGELRLVCRRWSHWLTDQHLHRTLRIASGTRAMQLIINQIPRLRLQFPNNVRPKCKVLSVSELWTGGTALITDHDMVTPPLLEGLIELFYDTIVDLDLTFVDNLSLPTSTIQAIGRIKNLRTLRLNYIRREEETSCKHDTDFFCSLLSAAQGLKELVIESFDTDHIPNILASHLGRFQLPNIIHLEAEYNSPAELVLSLAVALKPTLTMLSDIDLMDDDEEKYVPRIFEIVQDKLQGLNISNLDILDSISHLKFTSLRLLRIQTWDTSISDSSQLDMFLCAPIEILVLSGSETHRSNSTFLLDQFTRLPSLRKVVFWGVDSTFSAPENYLKACQDHQIECFYRHHSSFLELMEL
ncbi:hypothetical protein Pst134EA_033088 [Puccinia striiformis f. sp. tritici]|uniref:Uncharacterized protein n=1 Tax=Puccinia striiformis f. sp. tritici PST-78 TaxID=1165861 RepID=A0A0L0VJM4_9BASI|nr:hypothetical protein Pst134EA_033088 [Puccinia striiformis f. sp. tritici]KAH9446161.1 hypothetical protein Pst134EB_033099 [Puccinia striiformis f. sp. tritici]KAH9455703.1 hypothetical protein Pst134EA_033088 [Puccinia striiformis f. sp. tritici]KNE99461.1 hypothetical protein PSTG_07180 [Puccinia striiformis f. sp. tritici PST-78]KNE99462.1 hypothetical protein, variant [Puccinia striiformis f. sp. tritici PST-78]